MLLRPNTMLRYTAGVVAVFIVLFMLSHSTGYHEEYLSAEHVPASSPSSSIGLAMDEPTKSSPPGDPPADSLSNGDDGQVPPTSPVLGSDLTTDVPMSSPTQDLIEIKPTTLPPSVLTDHIYGDFPLADSYSPSSETHTDVHSVSRINGTYWNIDFHGIRTVNPSIIPHPTKKDTWWVTAAKYGDYTNAPIFCTQITCEAVFENGALKCLDKPDILPIGSTTSVENAGCSGKWVMLTFSVGPHDGRVFYGPKSPYIIYGSNSYLTCFGMWMQDYRTLVPWSQKDWFVHNVTLDFRTARELERASPYGPVEKNWFVFWDADGDMYTHHDVSPSRSFTKIDFNATSQQDLSFWATENDQKCMAKYMPSSARENEGIHQATNSLALVLCDTHDTSCLSLKPKTYIMHIYQHKVFADFHSTYEPYIMLFHNTAPFHIYGMTKKPFWVHGRGGPGFFRPQSLGADQPWKQTEMAYVTSMNWKEPGRNYTGHLDDVLMIGFGIEDSRSAVIDVRVGDLLVELGLCE